MSNKKNNIIINNRPFTSRNKSSLNINYILTKKSSLNNNMLGATPKKQVFYPFLSDENSNLGYAPYINLKKNQFSRDFKRTNKKFLSYFNIKNTIFKKMSNEKPPAYKKLIKGMKKFFFGPKGKITKKINFLKNIYKKKSNIFNIGINTRIYAGTLDYLDSKDKNTLSNRLYETKKKFLQRSSNFAIAENDNDKRDALFSSNFTKKNKLDRKSIKNIKEIKEFEGGGFMNEKFDNFLKKVSMKDINDFMNNRFKNKNEKNNNSNINNNNNNNSNINNINNSNNSFKFHKKNFSYNNTISSSRPFSPTTINSTITTQKNFESLINNNNNNKIINIKYINSYKSKKKPLKLITDENNNYNNFNTTSKKKTKYKKKFHKFDLYDYFHPENNKEFNVPHYSAIKEITKKKDLTIYNTKKNLSNKLELYENPIEDIENDLYDIIDKTNEKKNPLLIKNNENIQKLKNDYEVIANVKLKETKGYKNIKELVEDCLKGTVEERNEIISKRLEKGIMNFNKDTALKLAGDIAKNIYSNNNNVLVINNKEIDYENYQKPFYDKKTRKKIFDNNEKIEKMGVNLEKLKQKNGLEN